MTNDDTFTLDDQLERNLPAIDDDNDDDIMTNATNGPHHVEQLTDEVIESTLTTILVEVSYVPRLSCTHTCTRECHVDTRVSHIDTDGSIRTSAQ
jgi:hypothetical protein